MKERILSERNRIKDDQLSLGGALFQASLLQGEYKSQVEDLKSLECDVLGTLRLTADCHS